MEKEHLKRQAFRFFKMFKACKNEAKKRFIADQYNKLANMYIMSKRGRER